MKKRTRQLRLGISSCRGFVMTGNPDCTTLIWKMEPVDRPSILCAYSRIVFQPSSNSGLADLLAKRNSLCTCVPTSGYLFSNYWGSASGFLTTELLLWLWILFGVLADTEALVTRHAHISSSMWYRPLLLRSV
ncbi:hypothetical protein ARMGADRAFT_289691 [Armillaria gallica]|uniref:Uncharacterized protein n=1 Tax=Armillaria gallica TaxID=47427 RepID=A0A2H3DR09_ARMGA|nr:hypothetical protein ARMGADRAFT_289691 [Armillaria gallica]